jgi:superfamily I DNA and/or RNA helicase
MKEVLTNYKDRLIDISGRNRSLILKKIYKKRAFDLKRLDEFSSDLTKELLDFLIDRSKKKLQLLNDPYEEKIIRTEALKKSINAEYQSKRKELYDKFNDPKELETKIEGLKSIYEKKLEDELKKLNKEIDQKIDYSTGLTYLKREIDATEKESGKYELYVGFPFVEGKFLDDTMVRAPLLLFPVRIQKHNNCWSIENILDQDVLLNKVFIFAYSKFNEVRVNDFEMQYSTLDEIKQDVIGHTKELLRQNGISIHGTYSYKINRFTEQSKDDVPDYTKGELNIKEYLVLGQFPISNSIYNDYEMLEKEDIDNILITKLLLNGDDNSSSHAPNAEDYNEDAIPEKDIFFLTSLDFSQEKVVKKSGETDQLVVFGPPGTGKSQTIANIIADNLAKGKKILMVSQKRAALDVVYNRLSSINSKILLIHDAHKEKKDFYAKIAESMESVSAQTDKHLHDILSHAEKIDSQLSHLEKCCTILHEPREFGLTLQQMYAKTKEINRKEDDRLQKILNFKKDNPFYSYTYQKLINAINTVTAHDIIDHFLQYKELVTYNQFIEHTKSSVNYLEILEAQEAIKSKEIMESLHELEQQLKGHEFYQKVHELYSDHDFSVSKSNLTDLASTLCYEKHGYLLKPLNDGKWWSISYWQNYKKNKLQEKENKQQYNTLLKGIYEDIAFISDKVNSVISNLSQLQTVFNSIGFRKILELICSVNIEANKTTQDIAFALNQYENYYDLVGIVSSISELERQMLEYSYYKSEAKTKDALTEALNSILEFNIILRITEIEAQLRDELDLLDFAKYKQIVEQTASLMQEKNNLTPDFIIAFWNNQFKTQARSTMEFVRQATKKRALWPIRKYFAEFRHNVLNLFPCWLMGPETVSDILPLHKYMFDLIIFDEASQMFIENAIPTIFRGKKVIIAGDDKQLRPSSTFKAVFSGLIDEDELDLEIAAALEEESLLDLAKTKYGVQNRVHLNYHYRSVSEELINFSNYAFYKAKLQVSPNISISKKPPIQRIKVGGKWSNRQNVAEAERVVELVDNVLKSRQQGETIGIITFNVTQKDLIEDLLERKAQTDRSFRTLYTAETSRKENGEDISLFVKNIENVQGDERDIIIFSVGYAPNENNRVSVNFGSLSQDGGENRLNVAISRAKKKIFVVTSIEPEELNVDNAKYNGPKLFKKYLQYVREVSNSNKDGAYDILYSLLDTTLSSENNRIHDSDFEAEVYYELSRLGYTIHTQVGVSGYKIDLAVYDPARAKYILGIECDGATYHSSKSARERDIHRQRYLESRGWRIERIWSRDWWKNHHGEIKRLEKIIQNELNRITTTSSDNVLHIEDYKISSTPMPKPEKKSEKIVTSSKIISEVKKVESDNKISFGDRVTIRDIQSNDTFVLTLESNPHNRQLMKEIEKSLLGLDFNSKFIYREHQYEVVEVQKLE